MCVCVCVCVFVCVKLVQDGSYQVVQGKKYLML